MYARLIEQEDTRVVAGQFVASSPQQCTYSLRSEHRAVSELLSLTPTRQDLTHGLFFIVRGFGKEESKHEPRLIPHWTMFVIGSPGAI